MTPADHHKLIALCRDVVAHSPGADKALFEFVLQYPMDEHPMCDIDTAVLLEREMATMAHVTIFTDAIMLPEDISALERGAIHPSPTFVVCSIEDQ